MKNFKNPTKEILCSLILRVFFTLLILFNSMKSYAQTEIGRISIPTDLSTMVPAFEVSINGKGTYRFELDTGAGVSIITKELAAELKLEVIKRDSVHSPASDIPIIVEVVNIKKLSVAGIQLENLNMIIMDLGIPTTDGILSIKHFNDYLVTLDYSGKVISFEKGALDEKSGNVIRYTNPYGAMILPIEINGTQKEAYLDSGYPGSFSFSYSVKDDLSLFEPIVEVGKAGYVGSTYRMWKANLDGTIKIGNIVFESPEIKLEDRAADFINIGFEVMKNFALTFDLQNNLIRFERKEFIADSRKIEGDGHEYAGRYEGIRSITLEDGILYLQRDGGRKLKLVETEDNLYRLELPDGFAPANPLPKIKFEKNDMNKVIGLTFIHSEGNKEYVEKED